VLILWVVTPCGLAGRYQRFGKTHCLHHQGVTTQKTNIDVFTAVRTSNLNITLSSHRNISHFTTFYSHFSLEDGDNMLLRNIGTHGVTTQNTEDSFSLSAEETTCPCALNIGMEAQLHTFSDVGERPVRFIPWERCRYQLDKILGGGEEKIFLELDSTPGPSACSQSLFTHLGLPHVPQQKQRPHKY
jgi:hypothetical protein